MYLITRIQNYGETPLLYALLRRYCFGRPFIVSSLPSFIGVEAIQGCKLLQCIRAEIFLIYDAGGTNDKCLHARDPILGRRRGQGESANHYAVDDKVHFSKRRSRTLPL